MGSASRSASEPRDPRQPTRDRGVDEVRPAEAAGAQLDQPRALALVGLGERVGQRGAGVAQGRGELVRAVEVAERGVVDAVEDASWRTRETPPTLMSRSDSDGAAAGDEGVGQHHRAGRWTRAARSGGRGSSPRTGPPRGCGAPRPHGSRSADGVEVGDGVDRDRRRGGPRAATGVPTLAASVRTKTPAASISREPKPEPLGAVVVAAADHDLGARGRQPGEGLVGQGDRVDVGQRAVVDVAGDHHDVDLLRLDHLEQVVDERTLVRRGGPRGGRTSPGASRRCGGCAPVEPRTPHRQRRATTPLRGTHVLSRSGRCVRRR